MAQPQPPQQTPTEDRVIGPEVAPSHRESFKRSIDTFERFLSHHFDISDMSAEKRNRRDWPNPDDKKSIKNGLSSSSRTSYSVLGIESRPLPMKLHPAKKVNLCFSFESLMQKQTKREGGDA
jgi:hypothetical protein